jgi:hypothetical protein
MKYIYLATVLITVLLISSCGEKKSTEECQGNKDQLVSCYKTKSVDELSTSYCTWAEKEAQAKSSNNDVARSEADDHTDAIKRVVRSLSESDQDIFKSKTKDCKDH